MTEIVSTGSVETSEMSGTGIVIKGTEKGVVGTVEMMKEWTGVEVMKTVGTRTGAMRETGSRMIEVGSMTGLAGTAMRTGTWKGAAKGKEI